MRVRRCRAFRPRASRHAGACARARRRVLAWTRRRGRHHPARRHPACGDAPRRGRNRYWCRMTSVLIIDDHPVVLQGCRRVLEDAGVDTVLDARDLVSGYRLYRRHWPDVLIIDLALQGDGLAGLSLIQRIKSHDARARILVFSMHSDPAIVARALQAGATGYVVKDTSSEELVQAFEKVRAGAHYLNSDLAVQVALVRTGVHRDPLADLTPRELRRLSLLADGKPYGRIADELNVSYKTVVNTCSQLREKLQVKNLPELIRAAGQLVGPRRAD